MHYANLSPQGLLLELLKKHSQAVIARETGIHQATLSRLQSGETKDPGTSKYQALLRLAIDGPTSQSDRSAQQQREAA